MDQTIIIGSGISGIACARALAVAGLPVRVLDKGRGIGGRMATRRVALPTGEVTFDHGAQYMRPRDPAFAQALLDEAITLFVNGEPESAKLILRDLVNATVGFEALAEEIHKPAKSLHRMLSQSGNPTMSNVSAIFADIERALKVEVRTRVVLA